MLLAIPGNVRTFPEITGRPKNSREGKKLWALGLEGRKNCRFEEKKLLVGKKIDG